MICTVLSLSLGALLALEPAHAGQELEAANINSTVRIDSSRPPGGFYYPVEPGEIADFDVEGPGQIEIWIRRTAESEEAEFAAGVVRATGDGVFISEIRLTAGVDALGTIRGPSGTFPSLPDRQVISVPAGQHVFGLQAPADQKIFVRVELDGDETLGAPPPPPPSLADNVDLFEGGDLESEDEPAAQTLDDLFDDETVVAAAPPPPPMEDDDPYGLNALKLEEDTATPPVPEAPVAVESTGLDMPEAPLPPQPDADDTLFAGDESDDQGDDLLDDLVDELPPEPVVTDDVELDIDLEFDSDDLALDEMEEATDANTLAQPFASDDLALEEGGPMTTSFSAIEGMRVGPRLGLAAPARGDRLAVYLGLDVRRNVVEEMVDLQLSFGWYQIAVDSTFAWQDPYGGAQELDVNYSTSVIPVEVSGVYHVPFEIGGLAPYAGGGLGLYIASRLDDGVKTGGAAMGWHGFAGLEVEAGPGHVVPTLSWNGARKNFGNLNAGGDTARESLSTLRLNVAYLYTF